MADAEESVDEVEIFVRVNCRMEVIVCVVELRSLVTDLMGSS